MTRSDAPRTKGVLVEVNTGIWLDARLGVIVGVYDKHYPNSGLDSDVVVVFAGGRTLNLSSIEGGAERLAQVLEDIRKSPAMRRFPHPPGGES